MATTDIFICLLLLTAILLAMVSFLVLSVIKVYAQEVTNPVRFATPEEKRLREIELEQQEDAKPPKPSLWLKIMSLKPIEQEKELVMEHTFDGIEELDNPTPAWFMVLFYGSIIFAIGYMLNYHVFNYGKLQEEEYAIELQQAEEAKTAMLAKPGNAANQINENNVTVSTDKTELANAGLLFKNACSPCHGEHAQGIVGPNLTDAYWLHGGTVKDIFKTIKYGVPDKGMIAWEKTMRPKQIAAMANYILSLQGSNPAGAKAPQGKQTIEMSQPKRTWIYPKIIKGKLYKYRALLSYFLLALLFSAPFIKMNGEQLILLDVLARKFVFFGLVFWPQDFYLFVLALLTFIVFIVLFTVVFGRVFCGWVCPQTIFLEMVFRRIENWIEGDRIQQQKLDDGPLTTDKFLKKTLKHSLFLAISFLIANTFLAYLIGSETLIQIITEPVSAHVSGFISIGIFSLIFYLVFSRMRELVCTVACPYGRLQGVLLDNQSILVAYDYSRGEPRQKIKKGVESEHGDCIDCNLCVQVCPTGIDIRNGTQMECVNCTACIDACDMVMEKINRPSRLIGFKSETEIKTKSAFKISSKAYGYTVVLLALISFLLFLLFTRSPVKTTILRASGTLYQLNDANGTVSNLYTAEMVNKTNGTINFQIIPDNKSARIQYIQKPDSITYGGSTKTTFFLILPQANIEKYKTQVGFHILSKGKVLDRFETTFIAPPKP